MPYWRLSSFYFFYYAVLGVLVPYWGLYLQSIGFSAAQIGGLMALIMVARIVAPNVWAWVADRTPRRMAVVRIASLLTLIAFSGVFFTRNFWWLAAVMLGFSFFWHASLPVLEVLTLSHLGQRAASYGRIRLWGSVGFIVSVVGLGPVIDAHGPWWVLPAMFALMLGIWASSLVLPEAKTTVRVEASTPFLRLVMRPDVFAFLLACFLVQLSHGPYYTFYSIYLEAHQYSKAVIGALWAFGVICEIGVFLVMPRLLERFSVRRILLVSFVLAAVRWMAIGLFPHQFAILVAAQALHAATFGALHAAGMQMVQRFFSGAHHHRGQAIYGTATFGAGGALGSYYSGYAWDSVGPTVTFGIAAVAALLAFGVAALRPNERD